MIVLFFIFIIFCIFMAIFTTKRSAKTELSYREKMTSNMPQPSQASGIRPPKSKLSNPISSDGLYGLPKKLPNGNKIGTVRRIEVVGSNYSHFGNHGQEGVASLNIGDAVIVKPDPKNKHDNTAVAVFTANGLFCGYLPSGHYYGTDTIFKRLMEGKESKAIVVNTGSYDYYTDDGDIDLNKSFDTITIAVAIYEPQTPLDDGFENNCQTELKKILKNNNLPENNLDYEKNKTYTEFLYGNISILKLRIMKTYNYVLISSKEKDLIEKDFEFKPPSSAEEGLIRVILKKPTDISKLSNIICKRLK